VVYRLKGACKYRSFLYFFVFIRFFVRVFYMQFFICILYLYIAVSCACVCLCVCARACVCTYACVVEGEDIYLYGIYISFLTLQSIQQTSNILPYLDITCRYNTCVFRYVCYICVCMLHLR